MEKMENVYVMDHPLIKHKISMIRNKHTGTNEFRKLIEEIAVLMGYEALRDLPIGAQAGLDEVTGFFPSHEQGC